jgi:hypothetical protein
MILSNDNILQLTSLLFLTNVCSALYKEYYLYAFLFFCLTMTSLLVHHDYNHTYYIEFNRIDRVFVGSVILYGGYLLYTKMDESILITLFVISLFFGCIYLYIYGFCIQNYCFHPDELLAKNYHALLHLFVIVGHHFIIFL